MKKLLSILLITQCSLLTVYAQSGWVQQNSGTFCNLNSVCFLDASTGYAVGDSGSSRGVILKTSDGGSNWIRQINTVGGLSSVNFVDASTGFACGYPFFAHFSFKTTNGGTNWTGGQINDMYKISSAYFLNSLTGFHVGFFILVKFGVASVLRTTDGGNSWNLQVSFSLADFSSVYFPDAVTGYVCGNSPIFKTTNSGINWFQINYPSTSLRSIYFINGMTGWTVGNNNNVYKTTNGGLTAWTALNNQGLCSGFYSVRFANEQTGWICGCLGSVFGTTNGGANWTQQTAGTTTLLRSLSFVNALTGWAVGDFGRILKTTTGGFTAIQPVSSEVPEHFSLFQNYPNPFNPTTNIRFQIPLLRGVDAEGRRGVLTKLTLYDILGREIQTLVNEQLSSGTYETEFDGTYYPSGVYFYVFEAGEFRQTKNMVLIK